MNIKINRDSVCMGDDMDSHRITRQMDENATYEDLLRVLLNENYLPSVYGNDVVWVLTSNEHKCIFAYFTKTQKIVPGASEKMLYRLCDEDGFRFKYYSSPQKWEEECAR